MSFIIFALPRSRTAWLSHFLSAPGHVVGHEWTLECAGVGDFLALLDAHDGVADTAAVLGWKVWREARPGTKFITVRRPRGEVTKSLEAAFGPVDAHGLAVLDAMLDLVETLPGTERFEFEELGDPSACRRLFELALEAPFEYDWWRRLAPINIQVDPEQFLAQLAQRQSRFEGFARELMDGNGPGPFPLN